MKAEQLQAIKDRADKATPGPWIIEESRFGNFNAASENGNYDLPACLMNETDAQFVTNAREDIPALIAEVERLQKALKTTDADLYVYKDLYNEMTDKSIELIKFLQTRISKGCGQNAVDVAMMHIQEQEKEIERLREALEFYAIDENWEPTNELPFGEPSYCSNIDLDEGKIARAALAGESNAI